MNRVNRSSILMHFVMNVGGGRYSRIAHQAEYLSAFYLLSAFYQYFAHVSVQRLIAVAVLNDHVAAIAAVRFRFFDGAIAGGINFRSAGSCEIHAVMHFGSFVNGVDPHAVTGGHSF